MSPETAHAPEPEPAGMGTMSRIAGVFFEPGKTFEDIGRKPSWFVPLLLLVLSGFAFYFAYGQHVGWERFLRQQMTTNTRIQQQMERIPAEQREASIAMQAKFTGIGYYVSTAVFVPLMMMLSAAILLGITAMMSAGLRYKQVFAIGCFAAMPGVLKFLLSIVVLFLKNPDDFNLMNPLAFNAGAFMDPLNSSKFLYTIASTFDVFAIWGIILTGIGLSAAAGRKRLSVGSGIFAAATPTVLLVLLGASLAAMFS